MEKLGSEDDGQKSLEEGSGLRSAKRSEIAPSFKGYEEPIRQRLKMDYDNRPKISLWVGSRYSLSLNWCSAASLTRAYRVY